MQVAALFLVLSSLVVLCFSYEIQSYENSEAELLLQRITRSATKRYCYCPVNGQGRKKCYTQERLKDDPNFKLCPRKTRPTPNKNYKLSGKSQAKPPEKHKQKSAGPNPSVKPGRFRRKQKKTHRKATTNHNEMMQSDSPVQQSMSSIGKKTKSSMKKHRKNRKHAFRRKKQEKEAPAAPITVRHTQNDAPSSFAKNQIRSGGAKTAPQSKRFRKRHGKILKKSQTALTGSNLQKHIQPATKQNSKKSRKKKRFRKVTLTPDSMINDQPYSEFSTEYCRDPKKNLCLNSHTMNTEKGEKACRQEESAGKTVYDCKKLESLLSKKIGEVPKQRKKPAEAVKPLRKRKPKKRRPTKAQATNSTKLPVKHKMQRDNPKSENEEEKKALTEKQRREAEFQEIQQELLNTIDSKNDKRTKGETIEGGDIVCSLYEEDMPQQKCFVLGDITNSFFTKKIEKLVASFDLGKAWNTFSRYLDHASKNPQDIEIISRKLDNLRNLVNDQGISEQTVVMIGAMVTRSPPCRFFAESIPFHNSLFDDVMKDCADVKYVKKKE